MPRRSALWSGVYPSREFAIHQRFTLSVDQFRAVSFPNSLQMWQETYHICLGLLA